MPIIIIIVSASCCAFSFLDYEEFIPLGPAVDEQIDSTLRTPCCVAVRPSEEVHGTAGAALLSSKRGEGEHEEEEEDMAGSGFHPRTHVRLGTRRRTTGK